jgi:hypothetical protein
VGFPHVASLSPLSLSLCFSLFSHHFYRSGAHILSQRRPKNLEQSAVPPQSQSPGAGVMKSYPQPQGMKNPGRTRNLEL